MAYDLDDSHAAKYSIVEALFIATADENYVAARWCFLEGLNVDFLWLGVHCLEKYLKAALLLNGRSAKSYHHEIVRLYADVYALAPELLPSTLCKPENLDVEMWHVEETSRFIERLYRDGQADNRYQLFGYVRLEDDLFKLDEVVFRVRRLCQPLEAHFLGKNSKGVPNESRRDWMKRDHHHVFSRLSSKLEEIMSGKRGGVLQHALMNHNFAFGDGTYGHTPISYGFAASNPVLVRRLYDPLKGGLHNFAACDELWEWVQANIQLPKSVVTEIDHERERLKSEVRTRSLQRA